MIRRKYVPLRIVQPGMMIDQAIIDRAGRVLIARRTRLEDFHIDALKKMGVTGIYTCEGTEDVKPADADKPQELPEPLQKKYEQVKVKGSCQGTDLRERAKPRGTGSAVFVPGYAVTGFYQCFPEYYG